VIARARVTILARVLVIGYVLAACGGSSSGDSSSGTQSTTTDVPAATGDSTVVDATTAPVPPPPGGGLDGTCSVEVSGGLSAGFTSGQDIGEAYNAAWLRAARQAAVDSDLPGTFQLGCSSDDGRAVLLSIADAVVPLGATSVPLAAGTVGYYSAEAFFGNDEPTDIVLTAVDENRITGALTFVGSGPGNELSTVTMTFDFVDPDAD